MIASGNICSVLQVFVEYQLYGEHSPSGHWGGRLCGDTKTTWFLPLESLPQCEMDLKSTWIDTRQEPSATGVQRREIDFKLNCVRKVPEQDPEGMEGVGCF